MTEASHLAPDPVAEALLVTLCRRDAPAEAARVVSDRLEDPATRTSLLELARQHRVFGLTLRALERAALLERLSAEVRREMLALMLVERARADLYTRELERITGMLAQEDFDFVVLKGACLRSMVYQEPLERRTGDLDLLVAPHEVDRTVGRLLELGYENPWSEESLEGYRAHHYHIRLVHPRGLATEVHWALVKPGREYTLDPSIFYEGRAPIEPGASFRLLHSEPLLLHSVVQQLQDGFAYLARSVDVDRIISSDPKLDWTRLAEHARASGLAHATAMTLQLAQRLLGTEIPEAPLRSLRPGRAGRIHLALLRPESSALSQRFRESPTAYKLLRFWLLSGTARRWSALPELTGSDHDDPSHRPWEQDEEAPRRPGRAGMLLRLAVGQVGLYLNAAAAWFTAAGRAQMRFWSSHSRSSDRL